MEESQFILPDSTLLERPGQFIWQAPSNIALVKYWGKKGIQIPANPSLSLTLQKSHTRTCLSYSPLRQRADKFSYDFYFEGKENLDFRPKIDSFLSRIEPYLPFLKDYHYKIESSNSFPHSSGIASSASAFAALALCFLQLERSMNQDIGESFFHNKASFLARLGSGSACRSIRGPVMLWGHHHEVKGSDDRFAIEFPFDISPVFESYQDAILLVDKGKKAVSSTLGHQLMEGHPYARNRFDQANNHLMRMLDILKMGELKDFIETVESEALSLHAMMMTSIPYFLLMKPNTMEIIQRVWDYRTATGSHLCFTLDAGANVHLLFPKEEAKAVYNFIEEELAGFCEDRSIIEDCVGPGAFSPNR